MVVRGEVLGIRDFSEFSVSTAASVWTLNLEFQLGFDKKNGQSPRVRPYMVAMKVKSQA